MTLIYHMAPAERWHAMSNQSAYLPAEYHRDGFVHCTAGDALMLKVANTFYRQVPGAFVLLVIDSTLLHTPLRWEQSTDQLATMFPHIYGPINREAVLAVRPMIRDADGTFLAWEEPSSQAG